MSWPVARKATAPPAEGDASLADPGVGSGTFGLGYGPGLGGTGLYADGGSIDYGYMPGLGGAVTLPTQPPTVPTPSPAPAPAPAPTGVWRFAVPKAKTFARYYVSGGRITTRTWHTTDAGFSGTCTAPRTLPWPGHPSVSVVQVTSGGRAGWWIASSFARLT